MYRTCIHCHADLGRNEALEAFPVGRRLAFDAGKGRLWVVCGACGRWNLTPLEARWEAIEQAERRFRDTRLRYTTDNIGLARLPEGLDLVRIGEAPRTEMAAWRFGEVFRRRLRRQVVLAGGFLALMALRSSPTFSMALGGTAGVLTMLPQWLQLLYAQRRVGTDPTSGKAIRRRHLRHAEIAPAASEAPDEWDVIVNTSSLYSRAGGAEGRRLARVALAVQNEAGARERTIRDAVARLEDAGDTRTLVQRLLAPRLTASEPWARRLALDALEKPDRLALEMSLHEETEARALAGELLELEAQWQEAERIAAIADDLLLPDWVHARLAGWRTGRRPD